jgi:hypothetical protein
MSAMLEMLTEKSSEDSQSVVVRFPNGFLIRGERDCSDVIVKLLETCWQVEKPDTHENIIVERLGLFCIHELVACITRTRLEHWEPKESRAPKWKIAVWKNRKTEHWISKIVAEERKRLMSRMDPAIASVQRAVFAACLTASPIFMDIEFYHPRNRYLLEDIKRYRAAAIAVNHLHFMAEEDETICTRYSQPFPMTLPNIDEVCEKLHSWRTLLSDTGKTYRALNQTLDHLPGRISPLMVCRLRFAHLQREYHDRAELLLFLLSLPDSIYLERTLNQSIFSDATREEIVRALAIVNRALNTNLRIGRTCDLGTFCNFLMDYPAVHRGRLVGLAEASIRYHRELARGELELCEGDDRPTAVPPVPVPEISGMKFLTSTSEVIDEGIRMGHCIGRYADRAVRGISYLFHFDYQGEMASIEVDCQGYVRQSFGPRNCRNKAAEKGRKLLSKWGRSLASSSQVALNSDEELPF